MPDEFNLPASSFNELTKIIIGYSNAKSEISLDDLSRKIGIIKTTISRNSKFLTQVGIIQGGNKKSITELGSNLGRAYHFKNDNDIRKFTREIVKNNNFISDILSQIIVQNGLSADDIIGRILYHSGQNKTKASKAGARCIFDIIESSGLIEEINGTYVIKEIQELLAAREETMIDNHQEEKFQTSDESKINSFSPPTIVINIQLQLPESEKPDVYDNLFKSLRKNLIDG